MNMTKPDTQESLCDELQAYCTAQGLPHMSADDLEASLWPETPDLDTPKAAEQRAWLLDFGKRWDACIEASKPPILGSIGHILVQDKALRAALAPEVLALPIDSGCGGDCYRVVIAARTLLANLTDAGDEHRENVIAAAARQCEVLYFG